MFMFTKGKLILVRGLPGSGKTTYAKQFHVDEHFEADQYFEQSGEYVFDYTLLREAHKWCFESTREALSNGYNVVVANTFTTISEMDPYIDYAIEAGHEVMVITKTANYGSIHGVPEHTIERMRKRFVSSDDIAKQYPDGRVYVVEIE